MWSGLLHHNLVDVVSFPDMTIPLSLRGGRGCGRHAKSLHNCQLDQVSVVCVRVCCVCVCGCVGVTRKMTIHPNLI